MPNLPRLELLSVSREGALAVVEVNRAPVNAINSQMIRELKAVATHLNNDPTCKVAMLVPAGKHFAAGADIKEIASLGSPEQVSAFSEAGTDAFLTIERGSVIFIALVRGFCLGGGCELAMACHMRIADHTAVFGQPEIKLGICPGFGATQRLPRIVGRSRALYMLMSGDQIDAQTAYQYGLADIVVPAGTDLLAHGRGIATRIASFGRKVIEANLQLVDFDREFVFEQGLERETELFGDLSESEDMKEGFAAFLGKREPRFNDR